ncbi:MAG: hypothetical protein HY691_11180 [Chloroflexi bacterium]|nr:hypothetical protein [Chloroflexota bacterium]
MSGTVPYRPILVAGAMPWTRALPIAAEVLVAEGQTVGPDDVLARGLPPREPLVVPLAALLHVRPYDVLRLLRKQVGETFRAGEMLARSGLLVRRSYAAPFAGTLTRVVPDRGAVVLAPAASEVALAAHVAGTVERVVEGSSVVLRADGLLCQALAGGGPEAHGRLVVRAAADEPLTPAALDGGCRGAVVVGGFLAPGTRAGAAACGVAALVVGSVPGDLLGELAAPEGGPAILVTHWLGRQPMPAAAHAALAALEGRIASVLYGQRAPGAPMAAPALFVAGAGTPSVDLPAGAVVAGPARGQVLAAVGEEPQPCGFGPLRGPAARVVGGDGRAWRLPAWSVERWLPDADDRAARDTSRSPNDNPTR